MKKLFVISILLAACACAQTTVPVSQSQLPTYIMVGAAYNQFTGTSAFVSAVVPESNFVGLYGSVTTEINAVKIVDPVTKKTGYALSPSARAGQHKTLFNDGKNMLLVGGDFGASFSQSETTGGTSTGVNIGLAGSFTLTYVRQLTAHLAVGIPVRMLWMSGVGPGGTGVWNPVGEIGLVWKP
jgi:hypothetical protein